MKDKGKNAPAGKPSGSSKPGSGEARSKKVDKAEPVAAKGKPTEGSKNAPKK